jgi:endoglucanase
LKASWACCSRLFGDYFHAQHVPRFQSGRVIAFAHQVGGPNDHTCGWMPPELRRPNFCPRTAYFSTDEKPAADVTASAAAALAQISQVFAKSDPTYAGKCLDYAESLYQLAAKYPDSKSSDSGGLYDSEYSYDDLAWAALNLYQATGNEQYLRDTFDGSGTSYTGWIMRFGGGGFAAGDWGVAWSEGWTHCWNSLRSGVFLKMAIILAAKQASGTLPANWNNIAQGFKSVAFADSNKWNNGQVARSPAGFSVLSAYGSGRYNSAGQFIALVYDKHFSQPNFVTWSSAQMNYLLGSNPLSKSYVMGYSDQYANRPHHAAGHASLYGECGNPVENRHIVWGALVNGPDGNDNHVDDRCDFGSNEITIDYNASMLAALAGLYVANGKGQCPLQNFPPVEPDIDEFYTRALVNSDTACTSQIQIVMMNESIHPPRYDTHLSARYYFDISERTPPNPDEIQASLIYDRGATEFGQPTQISDVKYCGSDENGNPTSTYYVELSWEGYEFWGEMVQLHAPPTVILQLGVTNGQGCVWDPSNDWSHKNLNATSTKTPYIPVYSSGELIFGKQPPCQGKPAQEVVPLVER